MRISSRLIGSLLGLNALITASTQAAAFGALAIGTTGNVAADGMAVGGGINYPTSDAAIASAMEVCRTEPGIPKATAQCKIVGTFSGKCYAAAFDPKSGTPGAGWAIEPDRASAEKQALANCQATAGKDRSQFCKVDAPTVGCDKHN